MGDDWKRVSAGFNCGMVVFWQLIRVAANMRSPYAEVNMHGVETRGQFAQDIENDVFGLFQGEVIAL